MLAKAIALSVALLGLSAAPGAVESVRARDTAAVQNCLKSEHGRELDGERCIGVVAEPCLDKANSTVEQRECSEREYVVWDAMLNADYKALQAILDRKQNAKLREMQRAWIASRDKSCEFYWDFHQGHDRGFDDRVLHDARDGAPGHVLTGVHRE